MRSAGTGEGGAAGHSATVRLTHTHTAHMASTTGPLKRVTREVLAVLVNRTGLRGIHRLRYWGKRWKGECHIVQENRGLEKAKRGG